MSTETKTIVFRARDRTWRDSLTRMEVDRVTDKSVWINGKRVARESEGTKIFDDFDSAKAWLTERLELKIEALQERIDKLTHRRDLADMIAECDVETKTERW